VGSNPTPSAKSIEIIEEFSAFGSYAQSSVQSVFDDLGALCFLAFMIGLAIILSPAKYQTPESESPPA
jgi:hypothetical protein